MSRELVLVEPDRLLEPVMLTIEHTVGYDEQRTAVTVTPHSIGDDLDIGFS